jgi:HK97 family phage portal protein
MIPLRPDCLWPELVAFDDLQVLLYHYYSPTTGRPFVFMPDEVIHIQGLTGDGIWGYPLSQVAKNCIGFGLALEKHGNRQFSNGSRPSGVLKHEGKLSEEARTNLRREWDLIHAGPDNSGKVAILWEGMDFQAMQMSNVESQWVEAKKLTRVDAASLLNLPAHKLNELSDSSVRANLEEQNETYKQMTLTRWANRLDEEFRRKLLTEKEWQSDEYRFVFDWDYFLRADIDTLTSVGDRCVKAEIMNRNEARRMIGLKPYPGGEKFGSPAINPQPRNDREEKPDSEEEENPQNKLFGPVNGHVKPLITSITPDRQKIMEAHKELVHERLTHFLDREAMSLRQAAKGSGNFLKWLDEFYLGSTNEAAQIANLADSILGSALKACLSIGIDARGMRFAVLSYAQTRHKQLLDACSKVTASELPAAIESYAASSDTALVAKGLWATATGEEPDAKPEAPVVNGSTPQIDDKSIERLAKVIGKSLLDAISAIPKPEVVVNVPQPIVSMAAPKMEQPIINVQVPAQSQPVVNVQVPEYDIEPVRDPKTNLIKTFKRTRKK